MSPSAVPISDQISSQEATRARIVEAGVALLEQGGRDALTTRSVATAAGVQAPTIYRLFGDKRGLLEEVAGHGFKAYLDGKRAFASSPDALEDLRAGWNLTVEFGLRHPAIFSIMNGDPIPGRMVPVMAAGLEMLRAKIGRLASAGLLRVSEERALDLVRAGGVGTVLVLLDQAEETRDLGLSIAARESVIAAITTTEPAVHRSGSTAAAVALRASLHSPPPSLSPGEQLLLSELLARIAKGAEVSPVQQD